MENYVIFAEGVLPSQGKLYNTPINPEFRIRSMTTEEEMRRLSHSDKPLKVLCDIIDDCLIDNPFSGMSVYDMCLGDYQYLLHKLRVATYGPDYKIDAFCPVCGAVVNKTLNLDAMEILPLPEDLSELQEVTLPVSKKKIHLKIQTPRMLDSIEARKKEFLRKTPNATDPTLLYSISSIIESVDDEQITDLFKLENFLRKLPMADTKAIMNKANKLVGKIGLNLNIEFECGVCGNTFHSPFRFTSDFYGPNNED